MRGRDRSSPVYREPFREIASWERKSQRNCRIRANLARKLSTHPRTLTRLGYAASSTTLSPLGYKTLTPTLNLPPPMGLPTLALTPATHNPSTIEIQSGGAKQSPNARCFAQLSHDDGVSSQLSLYSTCAVSTARTTTAACRRRIHSRI